MKNNQYISGLFSALLLSGSLFLSSCSTEDDTAPQPAVIKSETHGVFVLNEGQFGKGNGAVSYIDLQDKTVKKDLFQNVNSRPLGDIVQSMTISGDKAYVVANNSNKVEVVEAATFKSVGVINGLQMPRYFAVANGKGYVTEWVGFSGNGRVSVIDLNQNTVLKTIAVGGMPEQIVIVNNKLYVANSDGNTVSVINTTTDVVESTITVGDDPTNLVVAANNKLWVLCTGNKVYDANWNIDETASTAGSLARINLTDNTVEATLTFASKKAIPGNLNINSAKNTLYYNSLGKVYRFETSAAVLPTTALINRNFYGLGVDPTDNSIFGADAGSFTSNGKVIRYNASGVPVDSFTVAIGPNNFFFK